MQLSETCLGFGSGAYHGPQLPQGNGIEVYLLHVEYAICDRVAR